MPERRLQVFAASLLLIGVVLSIGSALAWHKYKSIVAANKQKPPPEMPEKVSTEPAESIQFQASVTAIGTVRAARSITLSNEIAGQVIDMPLQAGQTVEQGQILVVLDSSVEAATLRSAQAHQRMAKSMLDRNRLMVKANASSGNEIDQAEAEMAQADAEIAKLKAVIAKKTLLAPFRAKAGLVNTFVGQYLAEGTELTSLQGIDDHIHIDFMMPQIVADSVKIGDTVRLMVSPTPLPAKIIALDSMADRVTRNLMGRASLSDPPDYLQPNDAVKVEVTYGPEQNAIAVPAEAVRRAPTGAFVFIAEADQFGLLHAFARSVTPSITIGRSIVITEGLKAGESIIADGSFKLRDGVLVEDLAAAVSESTQTANRLPTTMDDLP